MGINSCGTTLIDNGVFNNIGAVTWDTTAKTSGFTAVSGNGYFCNTTSAAFTVTLPSSPSAGDIVGIKDYANTADTNAITIGRNGSNINGTAADYLMNIEGLSVLLVYVDGTKGWLVTNSSQASDVAQSVTYMVATGGTITTVGDYKIHTFTGPGTFCVSTAPCGPGTELNTLVVAGGGSGARVTGGGGAGGARNISCITVSATGYPITVGGGGAGGPPGNEPGAQGSNSVFSTITSTGGGGGGGGIEPQGQPYRDGQPGGSGGGGTYGPGPGSAPDSIGGTGNTPPTSPPQGNNGGDGSPQCGAHGGGGGGGFTAVGAVGTTTAGGNGGAGITLCIAASPNSYGGGGGGGIQTGNPDEAGSGGTGGGGGGGKNAGGVQSGGSGTGNTGGGGGGSGPACGGNGGKGIVIIRYKFQ